VIAAIRGLLASRKFVLLLVGCIVAIGGHLGLKLDPEIIGMVLGLIAVGVGSIAYEDGQAKRATVIDGGALDGPMPAVVAPSSSPSPSRDITASYPTKADVVAELVKVPETYAEVER
jgi:hypothetical protein